MRQDDVKQKQKDSYKVLLSILFFIVMKVENQGEPFYLNLGCWQFVLPLGVGVIAGTIYENVLATVIVSGVIYAGLGLRRIMQD